MERFLERLNELQFERDGDHDEAGTLDLSRRHHLTVYDAAYLETAQRREATLATLDKSLADAAAKEGIPSPTAA